MRWNCLYFQRGKANLNHGIALRKIENDLGNAIRMALECVGVLEHLRVATRLALKPNFTYAYYKPGVSTSPQVIRETVKILREYTRHIAIECRVVGAMAEGFNST